MREIKMSSDWELAQERAEAILNEATLAQIMNKRVTNILGQYSVRASNLLTPYTAISVNQSPRKQDGKILHISGQGQVKFSGQDLSTIMQSQRSAHSSSSGSSHGGEPPKDAEESEGNESEEYDGHEQHIK